MSDLCIEGYRVSNELFTLGFAANEGPSTCTAHCCELGVYVDLAERQQIIDRANLVRGLMDETQPADPSRWFDAEQVEDTDYPSGKCVGTRVFAGKCTFLDQQRRCSLQVAATQAGDQRFAIKPKYCVLFPLEVIGNVIQYDRRFHNLHACCTALYPFDIPLFAACRDEIVYLVGEDGFSAMREHYRAHYER